MIGALSQNAILPIAGLIFAFVMTLELIRIITDKNNFRKIGHFCVVQFGRGLTAFPCRHEKDAPFGTSI